MLTVFVIKQSPASLRVNKTGFTQIDMTPVWTHLAPCLATIMCDRKALFCFVIKVDEPSIVGIDRIDPVYHQPFATDTWRVPCLATIGRAICQQAVKHANHCKQSPLGRREDWRVGHALRCVE